MIKKGKYECYECNQKKSNVKTYPGCTIRNTPSEPIHCIVWGKHLFNQLFGEPDPDQDVSPDTADPEAVADAGNRNISYENIMYLTSCKVISPSQYNLMLPPKFIFMHNSHIRVGIFCVHRTVLFQLAF